LIGFFLPTFVRRSKKLQKKVKNELAPSDIVCLPLCTFFQTTGFLFVCVEWKKTKTQNTIDQFLLDHEWFHYEIKVTDRISKLKA
jgi:hypothetical protein